MYGRIFIYIYLYVCLCVCMCAYLYAHVCMYVCICIFLIMCVRACVHCVHVCMCVCVCSICGYRMCYFASQLLTPLQICIAKTVLCVCGNCQPSSKPASLYSIHMHQWFICYVDYPDINPSRAATNPITAFLGLPSISYTGK